MVSACAAFVAASAAGIEGSGQHDHPYLPNGREIIFPSELPEPDVSKVLDHVPLNLPRSEFTAPSCHPGCRRRDFDPPRDRRVSSRLRLSGFEAADGLEAIKVLQSAEWPVDLVFSDVQMPNLDGFGLARWIRENRPEVRVLLASANPVAVTAKAADLCNHGPVVPKPYEHAALLARMKRLLALRWPGNLSGPAQSGRALRG